MVDKDQVQFEVVDRPTLPEVRKHHHIVEAVLSTLETGKAIKLPLTMRTSGGPLHNAAKARGLKLMTRKVDTDHFLVWVMPKAA